MNHLQLLAFLIYIFSVWLAGIGIYGLLNQSQNSYLNRSLYLAESFLLGSILLVGEMLLVSLLGFYKPVILWGLVILNYLFLLNYSIRTQVIQCLFKDSKWDLPKILFLGLLGYFIFRNYFFLITGDAHNIYLFAQKLWLTFGTSLLGDEGFNIGIFTPHFNAVPYALGISLFGQEVLFPQLIEISWRLVVLLLIFGYTSYRLGRYWGLVGVALVLFDEHFFYSGANICVIINGAVCAFLFASIYNFWESRANGSHFRFLLALIFLSQVMANKYQLFYVSVLFFLLGVFIQPRFPIQLKEIFLNKKYVFVLFMAAFFSSLWLIKNYIVTGCPTFPVFADRFRVFNWTPEMTDNFAKVFGGVEPAKFVKYLNYFYIWHGIIPAKILALTNIFLPFIMMLTVLRRRENVANILELCFWLFVSFLGIAGVCFVAYTDPRPYRYPIAIFSFSSVYAVYYVLKNLLGLSEKWIVNKGGILFVLIILGMNLSFPKGLPCQRPTWKENWGVLVNKIHMQDIILQYYPKVRTALEGFNKNKVKAEQSAWDIGMGGRTVLSMFLLPVRPQLGLWTTTVVRWDSYEKEELIVKDVTDFGVQWVMNAEGETLQFLTPKDYAKEAVGYERYPKTKYYNYNFPQELSEIRAYQSINR